MTVDIGESLFAERVRLESAAPAPDLAALRREVTAQGERRVLAVTRAAFAIAVAALAATGWFFGTGAPSASDAGIAALVIWLLSDTSLFAGPARPLPVGVDWQHSEVPG